MLDYASIFNGTEKENIQNFIMSPNTTLNHQKKGAGMAGNSVQSQPQKMFKKVPSKSTERNSAYISTQTLKGQVSL
jgi:hypothetical protein